MLPVFILRAGTPVSAGDLKIAKARELAEFLARPGFPFAKLIRSEVGSEGGLESVILEVEVELPQGTLADIRPREPIGIIFEPEDIVAPEVLTLREDFPELPHQNTRPFSKPRSLCIDEEPYPEQKLRWSPVVLIERIREWLRLSARGELHSVDQPLEPLLGNVDGTIILPHDFQKSIGALAVPIAVESLNDEAGNRVLRVWPKPADNAAPKVAATSFLTNAVEHGVINRQPSTLKELAEFWQRAGNDLIADLTQRIEFWYSGGTFAAVKGALLMLIAIFPKKRNAAAEPEISDIWVFCTNQTVEYIAIALGILAKMGSVVAPAVNPIGPRHIVNSDLLEKIGVMPFRPMFELSQRHAAIYSGMSLTVTRIAAIGLGALGSSVFNNLWRTGYGQWTLIDKDLLFPHNCGRHALSGYSVGQKKAVALAAEANATVEGTTPVASLAVDVLNPGKDAQVLSEILSKAEIVLDMSASIPVARQLVTAAAKNARLVSAFLNPTGTDSVILAEDKQKEYPLTWLEMEYYRHVNADPNLAGHLSNEGGRVRYARSCGDMSALMNQNLVAMHAAIVSQNLRVCLDQDTCFVFVFRVNERDFGVTKYVLVASKVTTRSVNGWRIYVSSHVRDRINALRRQRLPNETGGVLVGNFDRPRKAIYVVDVIPSPADSQERPYLYIRGVKGLKRELEAVRRNTAGALDYVGEWHTHPRGSSTDLSSIDKESMHQMKTNMASLGLPSLMLIGGDRGRVGVHVG